MAKVGKNIVTQELRGKLGDTIVFRSRGGETIVSVIPEKTNVPPSEGQKKQRRRFQEAVIYGKKSMQNPAIKAAYEARAKGNQTGFTVAIADFLNAPDIDEIDISGYDGSKGGRLLVKVVDDYMVAEVKVAIYQADGTLVEEGEAVLDENGLDWIYAAQKSNANLQGSKLVIQASDMPGNASLKEHVLN